MENIGVKQALVFLIKKSKAQGFISFEDIVSCGELFYLEVDDIERLTEDVLENNIIIDNRSKVGIPTENEDNRKSFSYIYDAIIAAEPELENFIEYVRKIQPAGKKEMVRIQYQILEGHEYARRRAIEGNLRIAVVLAYRESIAYNKNVADCISDACYALTYACNSYKPDEHQTFASYISVAIIDYLARTIETPLFVIPVNIVSLCRKLYKDSKYNVLEKDEALLYACSCYGLEKKWSEVIYSILHLVLLEQTVLDNVPEKVYSESCFENFNTETENRIERKYVRGIINQLLEDCLADREKGVLENRFGLNGRIAHSLEEVAVLHEVSRERIRQIERKGLAKLKLRKKWLGERLSFPFKEKDLNLKDETDSKNGEPLFDDED